MIANHKGEIPVVTLLLPFLPGVAIGIAFNPVNYLPVLWGAFIGLGILFISLNIGYRRLAVYKLRWLGGLLMSLLMLMAGCISALNCVELNNPKHFSRTPAQYFSVVINNEPQLKNGLLRFTATVKQSIYQKQTAVATGTLLVTIKGETALVYGDNLLIPATIALIDPPFNPAEFNYKQYLAHQNI